mgnify:CR=1 FL=1
MGTIIFIAAMSCNPGVIDIDACKAANTQLVAVVTAICRERGGIIDDIPGVLTTQYVQAKAATIVCYTPTKPEPEAKPQAYRSPA